MIRALAGFGLSKFLAYLWPSVVLGTIFLQTQPNPGSVAGTIEWWAQFGALAAFTGFLIQALRKDSKASQERLATLYNKQADLSKSFAGLLERDIEQRGQLIQIIEDLRKTRFCVYDTPEEAEQAAAKRPRRG